MLSTIERFRYAISSSNPRSLNISSINQQVVKSHYAIRGNLLFDADQLQKRLASGEKLPFQNLLLCNIGNPFAVGKQPLTFPREVIACIENKKLLESSEISQEAKDRAKEILDNYDGAFGSYSKSPGLDFVRTHVAEFIKKRDGYPCKPDNVYLMEGASTAVQFLFTLIISNPNVGIMTPFPTYPIYTSETIIRNGKIVPLYYKESDNWCLDPTELQDTYAQALKEGIDVRAMVIINPSNPTGRVLTPEAMRQIIDFCDQNNILLIADEVYQDTVYLKDRSFYSFKKMACQMKSNVQLVSLHSISKGFMGECGHRGAYMEFYHFPEDVKEQIFKMATFSLCPNTVGQVLLDTYVRPPQSPECSKIWNDEKNAYLESLEKRSQKLCSCINSLPGLSCQPAQGGWYLFPTINLPLKAYETGKSLRIRGETVPSDYFWCHELLHEAGVFVVPGSGFGQVPGTFHFRTTFLPEDSLMDEVIDRLSNFQTKFMEKYG